MGKPELTWKVKKIAGAPVSICQNMTIKETKPGVWTCAITFRRRIIFAQTSRGTIRAARQTLTRTRAFLAKCCTVGTKRKRVNKPTTEH